MPASDMLAPSLMASRTGTAGLSGGSGAGALAAPAGGAGAGALAAGGRPGAAADDEEQAAEDQAERPTGIHGSPFQRGREGRERRLADGGVLLAVAAANANAAHHLALDADRKAADEDGEATRVHGVDAEGLAAGQGGAARLVEGVSGALVARRGERLGHRDLHAGDARAVHTVQSDGVAAIVADADRLGHAELAGAALGGLDQHQRIGQLQTLNRDHARTLQPRRAGRARSRRPPRAPDRSPGRALPSAA